MWSLMTDRDTIGTWLRGTAEQDRSTPFGMAGKSDRVPDSRLKTRQRNKQSYSSAIPHHAHAAELKKFGLNLPL